MAEIILTRSRDPWTIQIEELGVGHGQKHTLHLYGPEDQTKSVTYNDGDQARLESINALRYPDRFIRYGPLSKWPKKLRPL